MHQTAVRGLNTLLPALGLLAILSVATLALLQRRDRVRLPRLLAVLLALIAAGAITRFGNQPIYAEIRLWTSAAAPAGCEAVRDRW